MAGEQWMNGLGVQVTATVEREDQGNYVERGSGVTGTATVEKQAYCID